MNLSSFDALMTSLDSLTIMNKTKATMTYFIFVKNRGRGPVAVVKAACSLVKIKYCGEPPSPKSSDLDLRPPSHSSHHPQEVLLAQFSLPGICAQMWPKTLFIYSFILKKSNEGRWKKSLRKQTWDLYLARVMTKKQTLYQFLEVNEGYEINKKID